MMFILSSSPLEKIDFREGFTSAAAGAFNCFEGRVRDHNEGKHVTALEYEAYDALCAGEARAILKEAMERFDVIDVRAYHRVGKLQVGDMAVWVGVLAGHRDDSFKACRYIIDELKSRLPIWKKEYYTNGDSDWIACSSCASHDRVSH